MKGHERYQSVFGPLLSQAETDSSKQLSVVFLMFLPDRFRAQPFGFFQPLFHC